MLLVMLLFGLYAIWDNQGIDHENTASEYEMYKPTALDTRTYDDFRKINPDVCGWLTIENTGIDYPLVKGEDNDEYMNTTPDRKFALSGSLFLDYQNQNNFSDFDTIIYGHHMEGPSMFGVLDRYTDSDFFRNHGDGLLYYGRQWHELNIFAFLEVDAYDQEIILYYRMDSDYAIYEAVVYEAQGEERLGSIVANGGGTQYPITLAEDEFFILGDNREESTDSRMFGPVKLSAIRGSVMTVLRRRDI